jgi:hypothetical protein
MTKLSREQQIASLKQQIKDWERDCDKQMKILLLVVALMLSLVGIQTAHAQYMVNATVTANNDTHWSMTYDDGTGIQTKNDYGVDSIIIGCSNFIYSIAVSGSGPFNVTAINQHGDVNNKNSTDGSIVTLDGYC